MAWRIADRVVGGQIDNTIKGKVTGWIEVIGRSEPLVLDLHGDCQPELAGWRCRIDRTDPVPLWADPVDLTGLAAEQTGQAGTITDEHRLRHYDCSTDELLARIRAGEPPPTEWRQGLYLEWYSESNGRIVIEDTRLRLERIGRRAFELTEEDLRRKQQDSQRKLEELRSEEFLIEDDETGITHIRRKEPAEDDPEADLQSYLDQQASEIERTVQDSLDQQEEDDEEDFG